MPDILVLYHVSTFFDIFFNFDFLEFIPKRVELTKISMIPKNVTIFLGPYNHNHGFLSERVNSISYQTQGIIDEKLEIILATGKGHGGH
ncbi:hypothetical protein GCA01S_070_00020 [Parageobacillus caldoxylosilyticus NBRC 107762]|uniref:Uncharacterized protein n=1 Tax=Parageobacillus caldoxylosilyticus NBRC 107762 TaxID=1220594 RepID=A0A023DJJ3_9BACL|nr:hypothetical protein GCA01S_070_00020 [Parageobacillus caldoxylosilyticus NBRC 107762]